MKEWFVSELQEALASSVHDVSMVLNYLEKRGDVDAKSVGVFGQGSGGAIALLAAAADPRITAVDVMDPWGDWPDWLKNSQQVPEEERAHYLTPEFLSKVAGLDPVAFLPRLKLQALRVEQVLDDTVTPQIARDKIRAAVPKPNEVLRYKDWAGLREAYSTTGLSAWLQAQLRPHTAASARIAPASTGGN
jgi:cephalosporin-C deacetylase-like acetyl esterase